MRFVPIERVEHGMMLAKSIYDYETRTLLREGKLLSDEIIVRVRERGYPGIYIEDELTKDVVIQDAITAELRNHAVEALQELDLEEAVNVAESIVKQLMEAKTISLDMLDLRTFDDYTFRHSVNVAVLSVVIGMGMGYTNEELVDLCSAAVFHDLGKISIDKAILNKPGKLTPEENELLRSHSQRSYDMLKEKWNIPARVKAAVLSHHENEDGSGYPNGLTGDKIHPFAKIIHVADVYDALSSDRAYKKAYTYSESLEYLMGGCGIMFDRHVVATLLKYVPLYPKGKQVCLSDGRVGIIMENSDYHNLRPVVKLFDGTILDLADRENLNITVKKAVGEELGESSEAEKSRKKMLQPFKRYRLLVVDDMKTNLEALRGILENLYDVVLVKSGRQALLYLDKNERPDLVLMDIDMPEMDGIEAARKIKEKTRDMVPILFITAIGDKNTVMACRRINAAGYILRPYSPVFVKSEIKRILTGRGDWE